MMKYILALDQGTSSSRAILFDLQGQLIACAQKEFTQIYPKPGWVEHDPNEIWSSQESVMLDVVAQARVQWQNIEAIGISNQRETTIVWDQHGNPIYNAIVWQDTRTSAFCKKLKARNLESYVKNNTGLVIDSYFSATKIHWILEHVEGTRERAEKGALHFGTVDSWLIYKLTQGAAHKTDYTNASRTMLFNIDKLDWDRYLLHALNIPKSILPEVQSSRSLYGFYRPDARHKIPILGVAGDQQAALFGQCCFDKGSAKNTYGTGCFMLMNVGEEKVTSHAGLLTTIMAKPDGGICYALEGSVFIAGAAIQWLRDGLQLFKHAADTEAMANDSESEEIVVVPAFAGLGAPYWDMQARGAIFGLTRDSNRNDLAKATLESLAFQTKDVLEAMEKDSGIRLQQLKVDGGAAANDYLMQFQADILNVIVDRPAVLESTAQGAAYLAGLEAGIWTVDQLIEMKRQGKRFDVHMNREDRQRKYKLWKKAIRRTMGWIE